MQDLAKNDLKELSRFFPIECANSFEQIEVEAHYVKADSYNEGFENAIEIEIKIVENDEKFICGFLVKNYEDALKVVNALSINDAVCVLWNDLIDFIQEHQGFLAFNGFLSPLIGDKTLPLGVKLKNFMRHYYEIAQNHPNSEEHKESARIINPLTLYPEEIGENARYS